MPDELAAEGGAEGRQSAFDRALAAWVAAGDPGGLIGWFACEVDPEGVPIRLAIPAWGAALGAIAAARAARPSGWPEALDARAEGLLRAALRFGRPDGSAILGSLGPDRVRLATWHAWAERLSDPSLATVARRWLPARPNRGDPAPPPLPAHACPDRPLAILRADWSVRGDWLAIDHRRPGGLVELAGLGLPWLGPRWESGTGAGPNGPGRPKFWKTGPMADAASWSFRGPGGRVTRLAVLFRGRGLALLADQVDGPGPFATLRIDLAPGVAASPTPDAGGPALALKGGRGRSARLLPLGLPADGGSLEVEGGAIVLRQPSRGGRCWLPLLVSWRPDRDRRPTKWRSLTVSERSSPCPSHVAFAARIAWGAGEGLVIYHSLAPAALRCFLGHQTPARFLVGLFTRTGDVEPFVKWDEK